MGAKLNSAKARGALRSAARTSLQALIILVVSGVAVWLLGWVWPVVWPLVIALLLTTLTWPATRFLRAHRWPPALAATAVTLLFLVLGAGTILLIVIPVASEAPALVDGVINGIGELRKWAEGPPLNISNDQVSEALNTAVSRVQESLGSIFNATVTGVGVVTNGLVTTVLALFLMFFFLKDGPRFLPWLTRQLPGSLATDVPVVAQRCWGTLGAFVRSQAIVGLLDAVLIGIGLWAVGVPLVLPLAVLTFVAAFVPVVGALFAGFVAVLIALVANGPTEALIVLAIIVVVQQVEGNVFQPMLQSKGLGLHAAVVLLAVTLGGSLAGIAGSLLAVPVAAIVAVIWNHVRERLTDDPDPVEPDHELEPDPDAVVRDKD